jgi:hypothetical protein
MPPYRVAVVLILVLLTPCLGQQLVFNYNNDPRLMCVATSAPRLKL